MAKTNIVASAALNFANRHPRAQVVTTVLDTTLPDVARVLGEVQPFVQKTIVPRKISKNFVDIIVARLLSKKETADRAMSIITSSERDYVLNVLDEVYAWAAGQGFVLDNKVAP